VSEHGGCVMTPRACACSVTVMAEQGSGVGFGAVAAKPHWRPLRLLLWHVFSQQVFWVAFVI
jgi:hypothetical protein